MTDNPNIVPEEDNPHIETVSAEDPPLTEEELPNHEDIEESEEPTHP